MKKLIKILILLYLPLSLDAQTYNIWPYSSGCASVYGTFWVNINKIFGLTVNHPSIKLSISDNFDSYTTGNLGGQGNWIAVSNTISITDVSGNKQYRGNTNGPCLVARSESFTGNHSSQVTLTGTLVSNIWNGPAVRVSGSGSTATGYYYYAEKYYRRLKYINTANPAGITIASANATNNVNDVLKITISGNTISCYYNGVLDTGLTGGTGIFTDTNIPSGGKPGLSAYGSGTGLGDLWVGADL